MDSGLSSLLSQLGSVGNNYKAPTNAGYKSQVNSKTFAHSKAPVVKSTKYSTSDFKSTKAAPKKSSSVNLTPKIGKILDDTLGQLGGFITNSEHNAIKDFQSAKGSIASKVMDLLQNNAHPIPSIKNIVEQGITNNLKSLTDGKWDKNDLPWMGFYNAAKDQITHNAVDQSAIQGVTNAVKGQMSDWKDGTLTYGDIPALGAINGMGQGWKHGSDVLGDLGVKNQMAKTVGGIGVDIASDPLNLLTGGAAAAGDAAKLAKVAKMKEVADGLGITKNVGKITGSTKNVNKLMTEAESALRTTYQGSLSSQHLAENMITKKLGDIKTAIDDAHSTAYNANINKVGLKVPFAKQSFATSDMANPTIKIGGKDIHLNPIYRTEATLGDKNAHVAHNLVHAVVGHTEETPKPEDVKAVTDTIKSHYGVNDLKDLSKTQFNDLHGRLNPLIGKSEKGLPDATIEKTITDKSIHQPDSVTYNKTTIDDLLKQMDPRAAKVTEPMLRGIGADNIDKIRSLGSEATRIFGDLAPKIYKTVKGKTANEVKVTFDKAAEILSKATHTAEITKNPDKVIQEIHDKLIIHPTGTPESKAAKLDKNIKKAFKDPYTKTTNVKTNFEHLLDRKNPFEARSLGKADKFTNSMANHIQDANSAQIGNKAKYTTALEGIEKYIKDKGLGESHMKDAIYHLEGKAPKSYGKDWQASDEVKGLANLIKPVLDTLGHDEVKAGTLTKTIKNYFPHVAKKDEKLTQDDIKSIQDWASRHGGNLGNVKAKNVFDNKRKTFPTIADAQNYITKLEKDIQNSKDDGTIESLRAQQERVANLFNTNVVDALRTRIREGIRANAMKAMQGDLRKYGMLATNPKIAEGEKLGEDMVKMDKSMAKRFSLDPNQEHFINKHVMSGMEKVDKIFTHEGMNKFVRHMTSFSDAWKPFMTFYKPSHYINNIIGNVMNNMAAGVKSHDYVAAGKLLAGYRKGKLSPAEMKIMDKAFEKNVISGGFLFDGKSLYHGDNPSRMEKIAAKLSDNKVVNKPRKYLGEVPDDVSRLGNFINGLDKFNGDSEKAATQVREYLFNYNELTGADKSLRTVVPFWNWTKRNVPLQMKLLMENPKYAMNVQRLYKMFNTNQKGADWQKESGLHVPFKVGGKEYYAGLPSPTNDLQQVVDPSSLLGGIHPLPKAAIELKTNKSLYTGNPITYGQNNVGLNNVPQYLANNFLGTKGYTDLAEGNKSLGEFLVNLFHSVSKVNPKTKATSYGG